MSDEKKKKKSKLQKEEEESEDEKKETKKKKKKSKVDEEESEDEEKETKKKKKSKVDKSDSDDKTKDDDNKTKKTDKESKIESPRPSSDVEKGEPVPLPDVVDPMKDKNRMKILKKVISHLCLLVLILGIKNIFLGLCAYFFYNDKTHLVLFGGLCIMQLVGAPIGWVAIQMGNRMLFLVCVIINIIWIICVIILLLYYWLINKSNSFNQEIALHVGAVFFMSASITLAICCFLMMQRIDMINITYKKPEVIISPEGKASEKAKLKQQQKS